VSKISYQHFEVLVKRFKNKEFGIEELQSRLNTALLPDQSTPDFSTRLRDLDNELERVLYTQLESEHFKLATKALDDFLVFLRNY
jgi:hypothetical protein